MSEWKRGKLGDHVRFYNGRIYPKESGSVPVYGGNGILAHTNKSNYDKCLIIGRVGVNCGSVHISNEICWVSDNAIAAQPDDTCDLAYIYYQLSALNLNRLQIGSGQPLMTQGILSRFSVTYPPLFKQHAIAKVLAALDKKIELNHRLNDNLPLAA